MPQTRRHFSHPAPRRLAAQAVLVHPDDGTVLLLDMGDSRPCPWLPGGHSTPEEPPHHTIRRLVSAQLGLALPFNGADLAFVDYSPANPEHDAREGLNFVFAATLTRAEADWARIPTDADPDIHGYTWTGVTELADRCQPHHVRRIANALTWLTDNASPALFIAGQLAA